MGVLLTILGLYFVYHILIKPLLEITEEAETNAGFRWILFIVIGITMVIMGFVSIFQYFQDTEEYRTSLYYAIGGIGIGGFMVIHYIRALMK